MVQAILPRFVLSPLSTHLIPTHLSNHKSGDLFSRKPPGPPGPPFPAGPPGLPSSLAPWLSLSVSGCASLTLTVNFLRLGKNVRFESPGNLHRGNLGTEGNMESSGQPLPLPPSPTPTPYTHHSPLPPAPRTGWGVILGQPGCTLATVASPVIPARVLAPRIF